MEESREDPTPLVVPAFGRGQGKSCQAVPIRSRGIIELTPASRQRGVGAIAGAIAVLPNGYGGCDKMEMPGGESGLGSRVGCGSMEGHARTSAETVPGGRVHGDNQ